MRVNARRVDHGADSAPFPATPALSLAYAKSLRRNHCLHAALEVLKSTSQQIANDNTSLSAVWDELGVVHVQLSRAKESLDCFGRAAALVEDTESLLRIRMHEAMAYGHLAQHDRSQRMLTQLLLDSPPAPAELKALLHGNLAFAMVHNEFYREALEHTYETLSHLQIDGNHDYQVELYTNLGYLHAELGQYEVAESFLRIALERATSPTDLLPPVSELSRLALLQGNLAVSLDYANQATQLVWATVVRFQREEIARLCNLFAQLADHLGGHSTALRLLEKSQLIFGQLSMWSQWKQSQILADKWQNRASSSSATLFEVSEIRVLQEFLFLFDALNAQELTFRQFSELTDVRVQMAGALCDKLNVSDSDRENITFACRFADYGLTALDASVIENPDRSVHARHRYSEHPSLSVRMLQTTAIPATAMEIIQDHHENFDGTGFPNGKRGTDISQAAQIFRTADLYASRVCLDGAPHSAALQTISAQAGRSIQPHFAVVFATIFTMDS